MALSTSILWSLTRSVILATVAIWPLMMLVRQIEGSPTVRSRRVWLLLAVFPFFVPELLIGFNYRLTATQLSSGASPQTAAICTELLYAVLQLSRCVAVGVAVSLLLPGSDVSRESLHAWKLLRSSLTPRGWWRGWLVLRLTGSWLPPLISWSIMALVLFQEFETAALMQIDRYPIAWSVAMFDAHAKRQPLADSLRMIVGPLFCELLLLSPALILLTRRSPTRNLESEHPLSDPSQAPGIRTRSWFAAAFCVMPGISLFLVWPVVANVRTTVAGLFSMFKAGAVLRQSIEQILTSAGFAVAATTLAMNIALLLWSPNRRKTAALRGHFKLLLLAPGLLGSLVLSLLLLAMFQLPIIRTAYDTWLPMLLGQTLAVLPKAGAIVLLLQKTTEHEAIHSARMLTASTEVSVRRTASRLIWRMTTSRWLLGTLVVAQWCFWDVTVAAILRPVQLEPVVTRLYNEMHYGQTEALMSLSLLAAMAPLFLWSVAAFASFLRYSLRGSDFVARGR